MDPQVWVCLEALNTYQHSQMLASQRTRVLERAYPFLARQIVNLYEGCSTQMEGVEGYPPSSCKDRKERMDEN